MTENNEEHLLLSDYDKLIIEWAREKGILENGTHIAQLNKIAEELQELKDAEEACDEDGFVDAIGDIYIATTILQYMIDNQLSVDNSMLNPLYHRKTKELTVEILLNKLSRRPIKYTLRFCVKSAYDIISKRKGKMINGQFVKS